MENLNTLPRISPYVSVSCCLALSAIFVASLYIWKTKHNRDHPATVKRRFCSVFIVMLIAPIFVWKFSATELLNRATFAELLGLRLNCLLQAILIPLLLTMLLFLGPLSEEIQNGSTKLIFALEFWKCNLSNLLWIRNHIVAPLSEEFVYRACMMPLILQSFSPMASVFITPLFFGTAHFHHIGERLSMGVELKTAILISCFQLLYTTLFGFYSAYLFARTGHFITTFLVHAFCNSMGIPRLQMMCETNTLRRIVIIMLYLVGFFGWLYMLPIATDPNLYGNSLYWNQSIISQ